MTQAKQTISKKSPRIQSGSGEVTHVFRYFLLLPQHQNNLLLYPHTFYFIAFLDLMAIERSPTFHGEPNEKPIPQTILYKQETVLTVHS